MSEKSSNGSWFAGAFILALWASTNIGRQDAGVEVGADCYEAEIGKYNSGSTYQAIENTIEHEHPERDYHTFFGIGDAADEAQSALSDLRGSFWYAKNGDRFRFCIIDDSVEYVHGSAEMSE